MNTYTCRRGQAAQTTEFVKEAEDIKDINLTIPIKGRLTKEKKRHLMNKINANDIYFCFLEGTDELKAKNNTFKITDI